MATLVAEKQTEEVEGPEPFTLPHFLIWARTLVLDNGDFWEPEPFQVEIIEDWLAGFMELWAVVPEGNAKTTLLAAIALYHGQHYPTAAVGVAASSREQAEIMYRQAEGFVFRSDSIRDKFKPQEGHRRIKCLTTHGRIQVYAADDRTGDGVIPTLLILDELHRHRNLRLYETWRGKLDKRGGQIMAISTAGEPESEFEEARNRLLTQAEEVTRAGEYGSHVRAATDKVSVIHDWAVRDRRHVEDLAVVLEANPLSTITESTLARKKSTATMSDAHWLRFTCNIPTRPEGQGVLPEDWDKLAQDTLPYTQESKKYGFWDHAWRIDTAALGVIAWESTDYRPVVALRVHVSPVKDEDVINTLIDYQIEFGVVGFVYDPSNGAESIVQQLEKGEHPRQIERESPPMEFIEHSQANGPMALAASRFEEAVRTGALRHDGNPDLRRHVLGAVKKPLGGDKFRYDRPSDAKGERRQKYPIDALTGLLMGHSVAVAENAQETPGGAFFL